MSVVFAGTLNGGGGKGNMKFKCDNQTGICIGSGVGLFKVCYPWIFIQTFFG